MISALSFDYVSSLLAYDAETGQFTWLVDRSRRVKAGSPAGCKNWLGYRLIGIHRANYAAHRLAWLLTHKQWPEGFIDHINGDPSDNRIANLRDVDRSGNIQNQRHAHGDSRTGAIGVTACGPKFRAKLKVRGRYIHLGMHQTVEAAQEAYAKGKRLYHSTCSI